jgi:N-succinyldiaminopimelate aminotransferase
MTAWDAGLLPRRPGGDVYAAMNLVAARTQAVNLGQAVPSDTPSALLEAAARAVAEGRNHYSPSPGSPALRESVARAARRRGLDYDPDSEVTILAGCTEAIAVSLLAVLAPGDEVLTLEPFYDSYPHLVAMAGARLRTVPLDRGPDRFGIDVERLARAITPRTRALLINSPHNPTGLVLTRDNLNDIAVLADRHDLVVISDEVYEELTFAGPSPSTGAIAALRDRTIVCSAASKSLAVSGWRIGWALAPAALTERLRDPHRFLSFCAPTPLQEAVAGTLPWAAGTGFFDRQRESFRARRDLLVAGLARAGMSPVVPDGGIVTIASTDGLPGLPPNLDSLAVAEWTAGHLGVVGLPLATYYEHSARASGLLRFTFAK